MHAFDGIKNFYIGVTANCRNSRFPLGSWSFLAMHSTNHLGMAILSMYAHFLIWNLHETKPLTQIFNSALACCANATSPDGSAWHTTSTLFQHFSKIFVQPKSWFWKPYSNQIPYEYSWITFTVSSPPYPFPLECNWIQQVYICILINWTRRSEATKILRIYWNSTRTRP